MIRLFRNRFVILLDAVKIWVLYITLIIHFSSGDIFLDVKEIIDTEFGNYEGNPFMLNIS